MTFPPKPESIVSIAMDKAELRKGACNVMSGWLRKNWRALVAEFVSTALLIALGCMSCIPIPGVAAQPLYAPFGFGMVVLFNIQIFGHISGAHMNPCMTLVALMWEKMTLMQSVAYLLAQCFGSICGYGLLLALSPVNLVGDGVCVTVPADGHAGWQSLCVEMVLTAALAFLMCALMDPLFENKQESTPLKFALTVTGLSITGGPLTGASMNPARSLGPALWTGIWTAHWVYWTGPFIGAFLATVFYKYIFLTRNNNL